MLIDQTTSHLVLDTGFPLWWLHTKFGTIMFSMFFLTWGLVIILLILLVVFMVHKLFGKDK